MVLTHSEISIFSETIVEMIFEVNVDRMQALTPLPKPSASTAINVPSSHVIVLTLSPHSTSFFFYKTVEADINAQIIHLHLPLSAL